MISRALCVVAFLSAGVAFAAPFDEHHSGRQSSYVAPLHVPSAPAHDLINNSYIVMFKDDVPPTVFASHLNFLQHAGQAHPLQDTENGINVAHVYDSSVAHGYAGTFSQDVLEMIRKRPEVDYIEQDQYAYAADVQANSPWGLARLSHRNRLANSDVHYNYERNSGAGVMVYVIDTGVYVQHRQFYGRARWAMNFVPGTPNHDESGHGTHVAGTIASWQYGVAKAAEITSLKVLGGPKGKGSNAGIVAGIQWAVKDAQRLAQQQPQRHKGAVINMSLTSARSRALDDAANKAVTAGVSVAAAAGNENVDACNSSPAAAALTISVAASTIGDEKASFSNWGQCVNVFGPGHQILSTAPSGPDATAYMSGTSMATPHVAGLLAYFISIYPHWSFNPRLAAIEREEVPPSYDSTLLTAYTAAYGALPGFLSSILPPPASFSGKATPAHAANVAYTISPDKLRRAVLALASPNKISARTVPAGTPNLLIYNNMTHTHLQGIFDDAFGMEENLWESL